MFSFKNCLESKTRGVAKKLGCVVRVYPRYNVKDLNFAHNKDRSGNHSSLLQTQYKRQNPTPTSSTVWEEAAGPDARLV